MGPIISALFFSSQSAPVVHVDAVELIEEAEQLIARQDFAGAIRSLDQIVSAIDQGRSGPESRPVPQTVLENMDGLSQLAALCAFDGQFAKASAVLEDQLYALTEYEKFKQHKLKEAEGSGDQGAIAKIKDDLQRVDKALCSTSFDLGRSNENTGLLEDAQKHYKDSLRRAKRLEDNRMVAQIAGSLGIIYDRVGNFTEAEEQYLVSLKADGHLDRMENPLYASTLHPYQVVTSSWHKLNDPQELAQTIAEWEKFRSTPQPKGDKELAALLPSAPEHDKNKTLAIMSERQEEMLELANKTAENLNIIHKRAIEMTSNNIKPEDIRQAYHDELINATSVLHRLEDRLGKHHIALLTVQFKIFSLLKILDDRQQARVVLQEIEAIYEANMNPDAPALHSVGHSYHTPRSPAILAYHKANLKHQKAILYVGEANWAKAEELLKEALSVKAELFDDSKLQIALLKYDLHSIFAHQFKLDSARMMMNEAKESLGKLLPKDHFYNSIVPIVSEQLAYNEAFEWARKNVTSTPDGKFIDWEQGKRPEIGQ